MSENFSPAAVKELKPTDMIKAAKLVEVIQNLSLARSLDDVAEIVRKAARELTGADGATFVLREDDHCYYADEDAISPLWKGLRFPQNTCISGWVMLNRQPAIIHNIYNDSRIPHEAYRPTFVKSLVMVPIRQESPIGAIGNYWAEPHTATAEEVALLQALADSASISIENVNLYAALEQRILELNKLNTVKDEFLMTLSHELRTPLNVISGWAHLIGSGKLNEQEMKLAGSTITRNAENQGRIVDDLLDTTRIMSGKLILEEKELDLNAIVRNAVNSAIILASEKFIDIVLSEADLPLGPSKGDESRVHQIIANLLLNAIKFSSTGGRIEVALSSQGSLALIQIRDYGVGILPEQLPMIFQRFWQSDSTTIRKHGGLGLGLAIAKHLVEAHGGKISVESAGAGQGSTFSVFLPLVQTHRDSSEKTTNGEFSKSLEGLDVLVVDDHADAVVLLDTILSMYGARVTTASLASSAMELLKKSKFDVLISDLSMPEEDGFTFIRRIRNLDMYPEKRLPAIALSAFADRENMRKALTAGFDEFVGKPVQPHLLVRIVSAVSQ